MTFTNLYTVWEAEKRNTLRPMSYSTYAVLLERFFCPAWEIMRPSRKRTWTRF